MIDTDTILLEHKSLCTESYELLLQENNCLRNKGELPGVDLFQRKRSLIGQLDESAQALRHINQQKLALSKRSSELVQEARNLSLRILLLDRDNEQLLLRMSVGALEE